MQRLSTPLPICYCPTRRRALAYPWPQPFGVANAGKPTNTGHSDYAINGGDTYTAPGIPTRPLWQAWNGDYNYCGPVSLAEGGVNGTPAQAANAKATFANSRQGGHRRGVLRQHDSARRRDRRSEQHLLVG